MSAIRDKLETCLARAADPAGEGKRAFLAILEGPSRDAADAADARSRNGISLGPLDGVILFRRRMRASAPRPRASMAVVEASGMGGLVAIVRYVVVPSANPLKRPPSLTNRNRKF